MTTIPLGAINKQNGEYVYPKVANKMDEYSCPECHKDLIICQGDIRVHHFRHKIDSTQPCHHYNTPSESQIHKDAKLLLKTILEKNTKISFIRKCCCCKIEEEFEIPPITDTTDIRLEYRFEYNGSKIADVVYIDNGEIICIFEICHTHKTKGENRPEPWFEIDALSLIENVNNINLSQIQIPCIRCEKCDVCIQQEKDNIENKKQAVDILYNWFQSGIEISPFDYDYANFAGVEKNVMCNFIDEIFDLILYVDPVEKYERYCIRLIHNPSDYYFTKEERYADNIISLYYLDVDWILSQNEIPQFIKYIACLDYYDKERNDTKCSNCKHPHPIWVKRINLLTDYIIINIGGGCCDKNPISDTEYINCERCNSTDTPLWVMETNRISKHICKNCDIDLYSSGNIYLSVSFYAKDDVKKLGAYWDSKCKKWFIHKNHRNIDIVLQKYQRLW